MENRLRAALEVPNRRYGISSEASTGWEAAAE